MVAMEGAEPPCQQLPLAPILPQHRSQVSILVLPYELLHIIIGSISSLFDRNDVALTCKCFRDLERATRRKLRVRRSANAGPDFLHNLGFAGFRNVTELDLSAFDCEPYWLGNWETISRLFGQGLPSVKLLTVRQELVMLSCAVRAWPCLERLEIQARPRESDDPFWTDLDWVDVLGKLDHLEELSFVPRTQAKQIREPFEGFITRLAQEGKSPRQYPSLTALRSCFFATNQVLSVLGKVMPNLVSLELINDMLDVDYSGYGSLTRSGVEHLNHDYPRLTDLRISGVVVRDPVLEEGIWLDSAGKAALCAFCQSQLSSLCLEGPASLQVGLMTDNLISSQQKKLHLFWSGWHPSESKTCSKLGSVTNLTDVSLGYSSEGKAALELRELVLANKSLRQLELVLYQGATIDNLGFMATNAKSLVSFTFESHSPGSTILKIVTQLAPARMRLQTLKLRLMGVGVARESQEEWPALASLSLEFLDLRDEEPNLGCWLQTCSNLTSLSYQCVTRPSGKYTALSSLVDLQSLNHLELGPSVTTKCIEQIMGLTQLRSLVLFDTFETVPKKLRALCNHPNLRSIALQGKVFFEDFSHYSDHLETLKVAPLLEPLLKSKRLQQVKSNIDILDLSSEFNKRLYVAP